jgi:hypothetical protein
LPSPGELFEKFDADKNGSLSREEFDKLAEFVKEHHPRPPMGPPPGGPGFRGRGPGGPDGPRFEGRGPGGPPREGEGGRERFRRERRDGGPPREGRPPRDGERRRGERDRDRAADKAKESDEAKADDGDAGEAEVKETGDDSV